MSEWLEPRTLALLALIAVLAVLLFRIMTDKNNTLECWQFIATKGADGKHYADLDKLGKLAGILFGSWSVTKIAYRDALDLTGFALVLTTYFAFVGGVAGYSAYLRSKQDKEGGK